MNLTEFAKLIGYSVSTVSRALNGYHDVNDDTRREIYAAAERFGYMADPSARRLRKGNSDLVAFMLSSPQKQFASPFFLDMICGVNDRLKNTQLQLVITSASSFDEEVETIKKLVERQRVDGLIFARTRKHDPRIAYLQSRGVPFVTHGRSEADEPFAFLDIDHEVVGREGCSRFIQLGHERIALLNTPTELMYSHHRLSGYHAALSAAGIEFDADLVVSAEITDVAGANAASKLLALDNPPTAIVCGNDLVAMGAMRAITGIGKSPGQDVGVIGSDNNPFGQHMIVPLTTFTSPTMLAGSRMAELLIKAIDRRPPAELQEIWKPELLLRASDGPPRKKADLAVS